MANSTRFYLFARKRKDGKKAYSARFFDIDGAVLVTKALGVSTKREAQAAAQAMIESGRIESRENPLLVEYVLSFWTPESDYARGRALRGAPLSLKHIRDSQAFFRRCFAPHLGGLRVLDVRGDQVERILLKLGEEYPSIRSVNLGLDAMKTAIKHFCRMRRIPFSLEYVRPLAPKKQTRGLLSFEEVAKLIALNESPRVKAAYLLGALCGLRLGECRGLRRDSVDFEGKLLNVRENFVDEREGLKGPKCGSARFVPMPEPVAQALRNCLALSDSPYLLFNEDRTDRPMGRKALEVGFHRALEKIGIPREEQKARNLVFHGLRHFFVSHARAVGLPDAIVMKLSGHKTSAMMDNYTSGEIIDFAEARAKLAKGFAAEPQEAAK